MKNRPGAVILVLLLIVAAVGLMISLSLGLGAISENQMSLYSSVSGRIFYNMDGCGEEALIRLNRDNAYTGETITLNNTSCTIVVTGSGSTRTINVTATQTDYTRKLQINVTLSPTFAVTQWEELII